MNSQTLLHAATDWVTRDSRIESAVLFGSSARQETNENALAGADVDLHVISASPVDLEHVSWSEVSPGFCLEVARPATGGVRKVTAVFAQGQVDLVIVPKAVITEVAAALRSGTYRQSKPLETALNEMATCLHTGFRFLKGEEAWGVLYGEVRRLPGVRLSPSELRQLADGFLCDLLWALQKLGRGELVAVQHALHCKLSDALLRLWRELRFRRQAPIPSFGLGRRIETLASAAELEFLRISARADATEIAGALRQVYDALLSLMGELDPAWQVPKPMADLLESWLATKPAR